MAKVLIVGKNSFIGGIIGICDSENGLINIPNTNVPGQTWSILNYFDTNPMVIKKLIEWYMQGLFNDNNIPTDMTIESFKKWIKDNSQNLFKDGNYLKELVTINLKSYDNGSLSENIAIEKLTKSPYNIKREDIKQFCSGSKQDRNEGKDIEIMDSYNLQQLQGTYCKIIVHQKNNPYWFDMFIDRLEKQQLSDMQVVDDHLNLDMENDHDIIDQAEDTLSILSKYCEQFDDKVDKERLDSLLRSLYNEAINLEN